MRFTHSMLAAAALVTAAGAGRAELPPGSYNALRAEAAEALVVQVAEVQQREAGTAIEVVARAKVLGVERSKAKLRPGDAITLKYTVIDRAKAGPVVGPAPTPVLARGQVVPAFLNPNPGGKDYAPAAYGRSFTMTPEAAPRP